MDRQVVVTDTFGNSTVRITRVVKDGELSHVQIVIDCGDQADKFTYFNLVTQFEVDELIQAVTELAKHNPYKGV